MQFPLFQTRNPNLLFHLLPSKTLFKCFCSSSATDSLPSIPPEKWVPFLKKKVVMRVGYIGTDFRGFSFFLSFFLWFFFLLLRFFANSCLWIYLQVCKFNGMTTNYPVRPFIESKLLSFDGVKLFYTGIQSNHAK